MNILIINHYAGSPEFGMEYRPYYLAQEWIKMGHNVMIVAASQAHVRTKQFEVEEKFTKQIIDGIQYVIIKTPKYNGNGISRVRNMFSFVYGLFGFKHFLQSFKPDVVIASSTYPLDIYPANKIAKKFKAKLFFEVHDLWPLSPMELGNMSKFHPFILLIQMAENYAYKKSDNVISMLPLTKYYMISHGLKATKWNYVPNGIVEEEWLSIEKGVKESFDFSTSFIHEGDFVVGYTGSIGIANSLITLLEAAKILQEEKDIKFVIVGKGPEKDNLVAYCNTHNLKNVLFMEAVSKKLIPSLLTKFDVLYIGLQKQNLFRFGISPNKLMDYMMSSKPIIQSIEAGNDMVREANCGISVGGENPVEVVKAILELKNYSLEKRIELGCNGHEFIIKNNTYKQIAKKFESIIQTSLMDKK